MIKAVQYFNYSNALEALEFYEKNFDAVINSKVLASDTLFTDALDEMGMSKEDAETFVMNAEFEILGQKFMASSTWEQKEIDNSGAILAFTFDINNSDELEQEIQTLETELTMIEDKLVAPEVFNDYEKAQELNDRLQEINQKLEELMTEWSEAEELLAEL